MLESVQNMRTVIQSLAIISRRKKYMMEETEVRWSMSISIGMKQVTIVQYWNSHTQLGNHHEQFRFTGTKWSLRSRYFNELPKSLINTSPKIWHCWCEVESRQNILLSFPWFGKIAVYIIPYIDQMKNENDCAFRAVKLHIDHSNKTVNLVTSPELDA